MNKKIKFKFDNIDIILEESSNFWCVLIEYNRKFSELNTFRTYKDALSYFYKKIKEIIEKECKDKNE